MHVLASMTALFTARRFLGVTAAKKRPELVPGLLPKAYPARLVSSPWALPSRGRREPTGLEFAPSQVTWPNE